MKPEERESERSVHSCAITLLSCVRACIGCCDASISGAAGKPAPQVVQACVDCAGACLSLHRLVTSPHGATIEVIEMCAEACRSCERICHVFVTSHACCIVAGAACSRTAVACRELIDAMRERSF